MWNDTDTPLAYFISFRSYGTWLHGDKRGSIDRFHNRYSDPYLPQNETWQGHNRKQLKTDPFILKAKERGSVENAIRETCSIRKWDLQAFNIRTNHVCTVVTANRKPSIVLNAFKANPEMYAPQFGGYCAYGMANGHKAPTDPQAWSIIDNKLYLNYSKDVQKTWKTKSPEYIQTANKNWPELKDKE